MLLETLSALSCFTTLSDPSRGWRVSFWFPLSQMRRGVDRTQQGLQGSSVSWPPQAVMGPCTGGCCHPGTFQGRPSSQLLVWWSRVSSSPFPSLFIERSPQTNLAVKEQAAFHCAAGGACMVFSIERSFPSVEERLGSSCFGVSALRGVSL